MKATRRLGVVLAAVVLCGATGLLAPPLDSDAAWTDRERGAGTVTSITVASPGAVTCAGGGLGQVTVQWGAAGANVERFDWTLTGATTLTGTRTRDQNSLTISAGLLALGTYTFSVSSVGPGGWQTPATNTARIGFVTGLLVSCAAP